MSRFKKGDRVLVTGENATLNENFKIGNTHIVTATKSASVQLDDICNGWVNDVDLWSRWTIYNNAEAWSELSDKKKGKFLLAEQNKEIIKMVATSSCGRYPFFHSIKIDSSKPIVYRAAPAPVKPEPTMEELFASDWGICSDSGMYNVFNKMIAKGWKK